MGHKFTTVLIKVLEYTGPYDLYRLWKWCDFGDNGENARTCYDLLGGSGGGPDGGPGGAALGPPEYLANGPTATDPLVAYIFNRLQTNIIVSCGVPPGLSVPGLTVGTFLQPSSIPDPTSSSSTHVWAPASGMWAANLPYSLPRFPFTTGSVGTLLPCPPGAPPTACNCFQKAFCVVTASQLTSWTQATEANADPFAPNGNPFLITIEGNQYTMAAPSQMAVGQPASDIFTGIETLLVPLHGMDVSYRASMMVFKDPTGNSPVKVNGIAACFNIFIDNNVYGGVGFSAGPGILPALVGISGSSGIGAGSGSSDDSVQISLQGTKGSVSWAWTVPAGASVNTWAPPRFETCLPPGGVASMTITNAHGTYTGNFVTSWAEYQADTFAQAFDFPELGVQAVIVPTPVGGVSGAPVPQPASSASACCTSGGAQTLGACSPCSSRPCLLTAQVTFMAYVSSDVTGTVLRAKALDFVRKASQSSSSLSLPTYRTLASGSSRAVAASASANGAQVAIIATSSVVLAVIVAIALYVLVSAAMKQKPFASK